MLAHRYDNLFDRASTFATLVGDPTILPLDETVQAIDLWPAPDFTSFIWPEGATDLERCAVAINAVPGELISILKKNHFPFALLVDGRTYATSQLVAIGMPHDAHFTPRLGRVAMIHFVAERLETGHLSPRARRTAPTFARWVGQLSSQIEKEWMALAPAWGVRIGEEGAAAIHQNQLVELNAALQRSLTGAGMTPRLAETLVAEALDIACCEVIDAFRYRRSKDDGGIRPEGLPLISLMHGRHALLSRLQRLAREAQSKFVPPAFR